MRILKVLLITFVLFGKAYSQKPRLLITTDIGQDPDDQQSLIRLLHYANDFKIEGIVVNADANNVNEPPVLKDSIVYDLLDRYGKIERNLHIHDPGYPPAEELKRLVKKGCAGNGEKIPVTDFIGDGKDTEGSDWILKMIKKRDPRPLNISVWGGACDVAQAFYRLKKETTPEDFEHYLGKVRIFFIGKQDSSNDWMISNFPGLWVVLGLHRGGDKWQSGYRGIFWGGDMENTSLNWLHEFIIAKNVLTEVYPSKTFTGGNSRNPFNAMKEGDTPSWFYFLENGLNVPSRPEWGGWGGRYIRVLDQFFRDAEDTVRDQQSGKNDANARASVFRWRSDFQCDFANRVLWGSLSYAEANHYPVIQLGHSNSRSPLYLKSKSGKKIVLDASGSFDPDGQQIDFDWFFYPEAGNVSMLPVLTESNGKVSFIVPSAPESSEIHVILRVTDHFRIPLTSYRRIVINIIR